MGTAKFATLDEARAAKTKAIALLASLPVVGLGITRVGDGYGVKVNLSAQVANDAVPSEVDGVPIKTEIVGSIQKR